MMELDVDNIKEANDKYCMEISETEESGLLNITVEQPSADTPDIQRSTNGGFQVLSKMATVFSGSISVRSVALLLVSIFMVYASNIDKIMHVASVFPLYSLFAYIVLHMTMYGANIYLWKRHRINYTHIFGFDPGTELSHKDVLFVSSCLGIVSLACFLAHVHIKSDFQDSVYGTYIDLLPLVLLTVFISILLCPFDVFYKSSRLFLLRCLFRCISAPFCKVSFTDVFLADQLSSQVQALRCLEFYVCYYGTTWNRMEQECHNVYVYNIFYIFVAVMPYWLRFLQVGERAPEVGDYGLR